jgi:hypothetical protein
VAPGRSWLDLELPARFEAPQATSLSAHRRRRGGGPGIIPPRKVLLQDTPRGDSSPASSTGPRPVLLTNLLFQMGEGGLAFFLQRRDTLGQVAAKEAQHLHRE